MPVHQQQHLHQHQQQAMLSHRNNNHGDDGNGNASDNCTRSGASRRMAPSSHDCSSVSSCTPSESAGGSSPTIPSTLPGAAAASSDAAAEIFMLKVHVSRDLFGMQAIRAAFPDELRAAAASGEPQQVMLLHHPTGGSGSGGGPADVDSRDAAAAVLHRVYLNTWVYDNAVVARLTRTAGLVRDLGLRPGEKMRLSVRPGGGVPVVAAAVSAAAGTPDGGGGGCGLPCIVRLTETYLGHKVYVPADVVRQLLGDEAASLAGQILPVKLAPASGAADGGGRTPGPLRGRRPRFQGLCYLRSYMYDKITSVATVWYLKGARTWLRNQGAVSGDLLYLEAAAEASSQAEAFDTRTAEFGESGGAGGGATALLITEGAARAVRRRSAAITARLERYSDGSRTSLGWSSGRGAADSADAVGAGAREGPLRRGRRPQERQRQGQGPRRQDGAAEAAIGEPVYHLRVRADRNLTGRRAIRAAFPRQLQQAIAASMDGGHGSGTNGCEQFSSSSSRHSGGGGGSGGRSARGGNGNDVRTAPEVKLYRRVAASADAGAPSLQKYTLRMYVSRSSLYGLALTRTAALVRDLGVEPGDRLRLTLLPDGRVMVAAIDPEAPVPCVVRLSYSSFRIQVYVPIDIVRQLLGPKVASASGQALPLKVSSDSQQQDALHGSHLYLRSYKYNANPSVSPYWFLTGIQPWLRSCGAVPGDVLRLGAVSERAPAAAAAGQEDGDGRGGDDAAALPANLTAAVAISVRLERSAAGSLALAPPSQQGVHQRRLTQSRHCRPASAADASAAAALASAATAAIAAAANGTFHDLEIKQMTSADADGGAATAAVEVAELAAWQSVRDLPVQSVLTVGAVAPVVVAVTTAPPRVLCGTAHRSLAPPSQYRPAPPAALSAAVRLQRGLSGDVARGPRSAGRVGVR